MTNIGKGKFSEDVEIKNKSQTAKRVKMMSVQDEKTLENTAKQQTGDENE